MEHFDLVEKLVNAFGVSYEQAKAALEKCDWDAAEAAVLIERQLKGCAAEEPVIEAEVHAAEPEPAAETREQDIPRPEPESARNTAAAAEDFRKFRESAQRRGVGLLNWVLTFLSKNRFVVQKSDGQIFLDLPIWLVVVLLIAAFWSVLLILGIVFLMGYRFSFEGPQLGKDAVRKVVNSVESAGESILHNVKYGVSQPVDPVQHPQENPPAGNNPSGME